MLICRDPGVADFVPVTERKLWRGDRWASGNGHAAAPACGFCTSART